MDPAQVLRAYAQLSGDPPPPQHDVITDDGDFALYPYGAELLFKGEEYRPSRALFSRDLVLSPGTSYSTGTDPVAGGLYPPNPPVPYRSAFDVFAASEVRAGGQELRVGWLWFAGRTEVDGATQQWCFPALSVPVERSTSKLGRMHSLEPIGDVDLTGLVGSNSVRGALFDQRQFGEGTRFESANLGLELLEAFYRPIELQRVLRLAPLQGWAREVAAAVGIPIDDIRTVMGGSPVLRRRKPGIALFVAYGVYLQRTALTRTSRDTLQRLSYVDGIEESALSRIFTPSEPIQTQRVVPHLRVMSARQHDVAAAALTQDISVLSGPPGTGKSHVVVVTALAAVARGQSVLVVASSKHAADVLVGYFAETPGPIPVIFDGSARARKLGVELTELASRKVPDLSEAEALITRAEELTTRFEKRYAAMAKATEWITDPAAIPDARERVRRAGDLHVVALMVVDKDDAGRFAWREKRRLQGELEARLGEGDPKELLRAAVLERDALELHDQLEDTVSGNRESQDTDSKSALATLLDEIQSAEDKVADSTGRLMTEAWRSGLDSAGQMQLREVGYSMESPRQERRDAFRQADPHALLRATPLWLGTLADIEQVLPEVGAMFDLVIFDEAAQTNPMDAASALARAKSAIVCGDPDQLGHTSFLSTAEIEEAATTHGVDAEVINPRNQSLFDVAARSSQVRVLDEHYRSAPHLIEFSARRFYGGELQVMTRHPSNDAADHIDVHVTNGRRGSDKINVAEVERCLELVDEFVERGWTSIGLITPFRAQADALEEAVLAKFTVGDIDRLGLRVGTVHGFQGDEKRLMIASLAIGDDEPDKAWQFVNQTNLFNVMVTRAREHMVIVTSTPKPPGLAGEYLLWEKPLVDLVTDVPTSNPWVEQLATALSTAGVKVRIGYRLGRHVIDLVAGSGDQAVAIDCAPHPDGAAAHLDRGLQLRRLGWRTVDAFEVTWQADPTAAAVGLMAQFHGFDR